MLYGAYQAYIYKNVKILVHIVYAQAFLSFCKYWPDDDLFRLKLVEKNNKIKR